MNPRPFIDQLRVRQMIPDIRQPAGLHRDIHGSAFGVVGVKRSAHCFVEGFAAEAAVDLDGHAKVLSQRLQHRLAQPHEVVDFCGIDSILYMLLCSGLAVKHLFQSKVFA